MLFSAGGQIWSHATGLIIYISHSSVLQESIKNIDQVHITMFYFVIQKYDNAHIGLIYTVFQKKPDP